MNVDIDFLTTLFAVSGIVHCYLIGLVAGKITEEAVSAGFMHAALLVIVALVASMFAPTLMAGML